MVWGDESMGRLRRGLDITKFSFKHIGKSPGLFALPLFAGVLIVLVICILFMGLWLILEWDWPGWFVIIILILFILIYYLTVFIRVFFEAAQVAYAHEKMEEGRASASQGLGTAWGRARSLAGFAGYQAAVNLFLKVYVPKALFEGEFGFERAEDGERDFYSPGTEMATEFYLMLPVILYEGKDLEKSIDLSKQLALEGWGETIVGRLTVGFIFFLLLIPAIFSFFYLLFSEWTEAIILPMLITVGYMIVLVSLRSVGSSVLQSAMYRYVKSGKMEIEIPTWIRPEPIMRQRPTKSAELVQARQRPKEGEQVMVSTPDGREERGTVTRIDSGMVTVMLRDGAIARFDESDCALCDE